MMDRTAQHRFVTEQAAEWLFTLRARELSMEERDEFVNWLRESPLHVAEMLRMSQVDQALEQCRRWADTPATSQSEQAKVIMLYAGERAQRRHPFRPGAPTLWLAAAALALVVTGAVRLFVASGQLEIRTQVGERRELTLKDGSTIDLAPSTELTVRLQPAQRLIKLGSGQAYFHVAKNPQRPFIVDAGSTIVKAVGTAFDVARGAGGVTVTVVEGKVAVTREELRPQRAAHVMASPPVNLLLRADEQVIVAPSSVNAPVRAVNGAAEVAWTGGNFVFTDEKLAEVVRRFNLYNHKQIRILDPALASRHVSGTFRASDPESLVEFVRSMGNQGGQSTEIIRLDEPTN